MHRWSVLLFEMILVFSLFGAAASYVYAQQPQGFSLTLASANCSVTNYVVASTITVSGNVILGGGYPLNGIYFGGNYTVITLTKNLASFTAGNYTWTGSFGRDRFTPRSLSYPTQAEADFNYSFGGPGAALLGTSIQYCAVTVRAYGPDGTLLATANVTPFSSTGLSADFLTRYLITLPTIPSAMFGITGGAWPNGYGGQYGFDIVAGGQIFQLLFYVGILGLVVASLLSLLFLGFGAFGGGDMNTFRLLTGAVFAFFAMVVMLPLYDILAVGFNSLSYWIISPDAPTYNGAVVMVQGLLNKGFLPPGGSFWGFLQNPLVGTVNGIAQAVMYVLYLILIPILGLARIFLMVAFVAIGPLIIILSMIPLTKHVSQQLFSSIVGLILAAPVAAVFIRLGFMVLSGLEPNANLLIPGGGFFTFLVVAASIFGAAFIPMVLAPMTGFFFQTLSQVGMTAAATGVMAGVMGPGAAAMPAGAAFLTGAKGAAAGGVGLLGQIRGGLGGIGKSLPTISKDAASNMGLMMLTGVGSVTGAREMMKPITYKIGLKTPTETAAKVKAGLATQGGPGAAMGKINSLLDPSVVNMANPTSSSFKYIHAQTQGEGLDENGMPTDPMTAAYLMAGSNGTMKADEAAKLSRLVGSKERGELAAHLRANPADHVKLVSLMKPVQMQEVSRVVPAQQRVLDDLANQGLGGNDVSYAGRVAPNGAVFDETVKWDPRSDEGHNAASALRDTWTSMTPAQYANEMVNHKRITPEEAKNPYLVGALHQMTADKLSNLNPNEANGATAIRNIKRNIDAYQHYMNNQ